jgi:coenzyme Q-binding protein COQ10
MQRLLSRSRSRIGAQSFSERRVLPFDVAHVFSVVAGVEHYAAFVPWCVSSRVLQRTPTSLEAELGVGFSGFSEAYTSRVTLASPTRVTAVASGTALFDELETEWVLLPGGAPRTTGIDFSVRWHFRSQLLGSTAALFREQVAAHMVGAFEQRCAATRDEWDALRGAREAEEKSHSIIEIERAKEAERSALATTAGRATGGGPAARGDARRLFKPPRTLSSGLWGEY